MHRDVLSTDTNKRRLIKEEEGDIRRWRRKSGKKREGEEKEGGKENKKDKWKRNEKEKDWQCKKFIMTFAKKS